MNFTYSVSKTPFARRLGQPTGAARGFYPLNMKLNLLKFARSLALGTTFVVTAAALFAADAKTEKKADKKAAAAKSGLIQDDFSFQKACIGA